MAKALLINFSGEGHVNPTVGLVEELIRRGEEVVYVGGERYRERIEKTGADFRGYQESFLANSHRLHTDQWQEKMREMFPKMLDFMEKITPEILEKVKGEQFDYCLYDMMFLPGLIAAQVLGLPRIAFSTTFVWKETPPFGRERTAGLLEVMKKLTKKMADRYGIDLSPDDFPSFGDMTLVFTSRYFQPDADTFDDSVKFVGPSIAPRKDCEMDIPLGEHGDRRVIYVSMGTIVNYQVELYRKCIEAFRDLDVTVILSIGQHTPLEELPEIPDNFIVRHYVPQLEVLKHADLFITHGGMNSTNEGLYYGVPLLIIPLVNDQPFVAKRVKELGAGIVLDPSTVTAAMLRESAEKIWTDPRFAQNSRLISETLREAGGYRRAVDEILRFKDSRQTVPASDDNRK
ncbi:glycosyl transferase [Polycladomyces sp. WAk]|uniref:Glycosyl transferase n=1 Tax=Polycladomyces zharkentensis TaxID=2807616 RepID=A0ABS2WLB5_9BACL|nr:macrolide family glycosyltransferase [Polycladomyces sp. WAk]MBN2910302.1 glycosyl transferase [Polycladomyces sp. WAk]